MTVSESELVNFLRAVDDATWVSNSSWVKLGYLARASKGPNDLDRLREYADLDVMEDYIWKNGDRIRLRKRGMQAVKEGSLGRHVEREFRISNSPEPDVLTSKNPFSDSWMESGSDVPFESVSLHGNGPFRRDELRRYLCSRFSVEVDRMGKKTQDPNLLVLGRKNWSEEDITTFLCGQRVSQIQVCSQEMLLSWIYTGINPGQYPESVASFVNGHAPLEHVGSLIQEGDIESKVELVIDGDFVDVRDHGQEDGSRVKSRSSDGFSPEDPFSRSWLRSYVSIPVDTGVISGSGPLMEETIWTYSIE
jgi:hypothetical protein